MADAEDVILFCMIAALVATLLFLLTIPIIGLFGGIHVVTTADGSHTGVVTAVEEEGIWFKTWRVYFKTDAQSSQEDVYCLIDDSLVSELKKHARNKETVTITYYDLMMPGWDECKSGDIAIISGVSK